MKRMSLTVVVGALIPPEEVCSLPKGLESELVMINSSVYLSAFSARNIHSTKGSAPLSGSAVQALEIAMAKCRTLPTRDQNVFARYGMRIYLLQNEEETLLKTTAAAAASSDASLPLKKSSGLHSSAYMLFCSDRRRLEKSQGNPTGGAKFIKQLGDEWAVLPQVERDRYQAMYLEDLAKFNAKNASLQQK